MAKQIQAKSQVKGKDINSYCLWQESIMMAILTSKWVFLEREHEKLALTLSLFTHFLSSSLQVSYVCSTSSNLAKIFKKEKEINCFICVKTNDSQKFCNYSGWKAFSLQRTLLETLEILCRDILRNVKDVPKNIKYCLN